MVIAEIPAIASPLIKAQITDMIISFLMTLVGK